VNQNTQNQSEVLGITSPNITLPKIDVTEELLKAFAWFDIEKISGLVPEDCTFGDYDNKYGFLSEWKGRFEELEDEMPYLNFPMLIVEGSCHYCLLKDACKAAKSKVYCFVENDVSTHNKVFSLVVQQNEANEITELYVCHRAGHVTLPMHMR
jgi:hypothetical protein